MSTTSGPAGSPGYRPGPTAADGARSRSRVPWWGDRPVKTKVLAAAAVTAALVGILGLQALSRSAGTTHAMYGVNIHSPAATADMRFALSDLRIAARSAALAATREKTQEYLDGILEITKRFENAARSYKAAGGRPSRCGSSTRRPLRTPTTSG
jgi:methyl-accepting chemotaxis protein